KGLFMDQIEHVYYIKTAAEKTAEPTESDNYQFSYSRAKEVAPLLASQLSSKEAPQFDERTNTIFFRETRSNIDTVRKLLVTIDKPTKQVMIEARLVEVTANPRQSYGINWAGTVGSSTNAQTFSYGAPANTSGSTTSTSGNIPLNNFALGNPANNNILGTMKVKPEISNKVGDSTFVFAGATVSSPIIDTRTLESNVLIRSGDTLAIGGLLQDEVGKARNKVPLLGDVPVLGYLFQERL